jgi:SAM-dependent methyltransferase
MTPSSHSAHLNHSHSPSSSPNTNLLPGEQEWDELYSGAERIWSDNPNAHLAATAAELQPGRALDLGCGEGVDLVWLAERGWTGVGIDISARALARASTVAHSHGVTDQITWVHADARNWFAVNQESFDLISAQFFHLPAGERNDILRAAAEHLREGGTLLIVGHTPPEEGSEHSHAHGPDFFFTADQIVDIINSAAPGAGNGATTQPSGDSMIPARWAVDSATVIPRAVPDPRSAHSADAVVRLRKLPANAA